jgi:hypothetical protein
MTSGRERTRTESWEKYGLIFGPQKTSAWYEMATMMPFLDDTQNGPDIRVYFSGRDTSGVARIGYFIADALNGFAVRRVSAGPVLDVGPLGAFDDNGVTGGCIVTRGKTKYLYYAGWSRGVTVPFYDYVGLAVSTDNGESFKRVSAAPILDRNSVDPYLTGPPHVVFEDGLWRMWYGSGVRWELANGQPKHYYHIKYAESRDGIHWKREGHVCIDFASSDEYSIAKPMVLKDSDCYRMWYAYRGSSYRIGYAESPDGMVWRRFDKNAGISISPTGWDSEMIEYAYVADCSGSRYMLYNGNGYGRSGIGYAQQRTATSKSNVEAKIG